MIYISFKNWKKAYKQRDAWALKLQEDKALLQTQLKNALDILKQLREASYIKDSKGRLRDSVTGRFVSEADIKRHEVHDQLRRELEKPICWETLRNAGK